MWHSEDDEDGPDGYEAVDVEESVQGVECHNVLALPLHLNLDLVVVFLSSRFLSLTH